MGWSSGSSILSEVMQATFPHMKSKGRKEAALRLISYFEGEDCDTVMECMGDFPEFDEAMKELNPEYFEEE